MQISPFHSLPPRHLYQILKLRFDVFVLEQTCFYDEFDEIDYDSIHFYIEKENKVVAYLRLYRKTPELIAFGRVVVHPDFRKQQLGKQLIEACIDYAKKEMPAKKIIIGAQEHLQGYYGQFGFETVSEPYDDEGIMHVDMEVGM